MTQCPLEKTMGLLKKTMSMDSTAIMVQVVVLRTWIVSEEREFLAIARRQDV